MLTLLLLALVFGLRKLQHLRLVKGSDLAFEGDSVKVLATFPISRTQNILFVDILDDVVVIAQSQNAINLLFKLESDKVEALRQNDRLGATHRTNETHQYHYR